MMSALSARVLLVLSVTGYTRAGEPDRSCALRQWADYYAALYTVPPEFVRAVIEVESAWQPTAVSGKGAAGLMQLMPGTAVRLGVTNRFDIQQNIQAGVAYLAHLLSVFKGDVRLAAAAYVSGEGRILAAGLRYSNAAVYDYVEKVLRLYQENRTEQRRSRPAAANAFPGGGFP